MLESSSKKSKKINTAKKSSPNKKRTVSRKAKKPKVVLAKNKVAKLCGLICGICVLSIGLTVILNQDEKKFSQKTEVVVKPETKNKRIRTKVE